MLLLLALACGPADPEPASPDPGPSTEVPDTDALVHTGDTAAPIEDTDPPPPPPCVDDSMEDNDDLNSAVPWAPDALMVFDDDPDYFWFELQPGETRRVELSFDHSDGNIDLTVYNELYIPVATSYSFSDDETVEVTNTSSVPTIARIRVLLRDPGCNGYSVAVWPVGDGEG